MAERKSEPSPAVEAIEVERELEVEFTKEEYHDLAKSLAEQNEALEETEVTKKRVAKDFSDAMIVIKRSIRSLTRKMRDGFELKLVPCKIIKDFEHGTRDITRLDTGEVLPPETMTAEEMQTSFPVEGQN